MALQTENFQFVTAHFITGTNCGRRLLCRYLSHRLCDFSPEASGDLSQPEAPKHCPSMVAGILCGIYPAVPAVDLGQAIWCVERGSVF